jgi:hypothetical protein
MEKIMSYEEFKEELKSRVRSELDMKAIFTVIHRNNGCSYEGMAILSPDKKISRNLAVEEFYKEYVDLAVLGEEGIGTVWEDIKEMYFENIPVECFDVSGLSDYEKVKGRLRIRMINYDLNEERLEDMPHIRFLDFALTFSILVKSDKSGTASIAIHNRHLNVWHRDTGEIYKAALENMQENYKMYTLKEVMIAAGREEEVEDVDIQGHVLTNTENNFGASCILCDGVLEEYAEKMNCEKVVILPCSVHEVILMPYSSEKGEEYLEFYDEVVRSVSESVLGKEEYLSDHIYIYSREKD